MNLEGYILILVMLPLFKLAFCEYLKACVLLICICCKFLCPKMTVLKLAFTCPWELGLIKTDDEAKQILA